MDGAATLDGELKLLLIEDFEDRAAPGDVFEILTATSITGEFSNAQNGARIATVGGKGSFLINYTNEAVTVSDFEPAEPGEAELAVVSLFRLENENQTLSFKVAGSIGHSYQVETSTNMIDWEVLHTQLIDFDESFRFEYILEENENRRFFRVSPEIE